VERILIFIDWYLPGYKAGGPIQSVANLVNFLKKHYIVDIITRNIDYTETIPYYNVKSNHWNDIEQNVRVFYFDEKTLSYSKIDHFIQPSIYRIVYITGIYSRYFSFLPMLIAKRKKIEKIIVAPRGMFSSQAMLIKPIRKKIFLFFAHKLKFYKSTILHATNTHEEKILRNIFPTQPIKISPNFPRFNDEVFQPLEKKEQQLNLLFLGRISPEKNLHFAMKCLSKITNSSIKFTVYGSVYDKEYWLKCKTMAENLPSNIQFSYKGSIKSEMVFDIIKENHALFMPSLGENFGHSIYETMAVGRLVIISKNTPWHNLNEKNCGWDISLKQEDDFISTIENLVKMPQALYDNWCKSAYIYAKEYLEREKICNLALSLFEHE
jgi:glycosyltransferase involved in cell wall biosynthesis